MEHLGKDFEKYTKKIKWRRRLVTAGISVLATCLVISAAYVARKIYLGKEEARAVEKAQVYAEIASLNMTFQAHDMGTNSLLSGTISGSFVKNVDGYPVAWNDAAWDYGQSGKTNYSLFPSDSNLKGNMLFSPTDNGGQDIKLFNGDVSKKIVNFYSDDQVVHEAGTLSTLKNQLAEVAVSFDRPYSYSEIQKMVPDNLMTNWLWIGSSGSVKGGGEIGLSTTTDFYSDGNPVNGRKKLAYSSNATPLVTETMYTDFVAAVKRSVDLEDTPLTYKDQVTGKTEAVYDQFAEAVKFVKKYPSLDQAKFSGVILTGWTENLAQLDKESWAKATSVGATVTIVPYLAPYK